MRNNSDQIPFFVISVERENLKRFANEAATNTLRRILEERNFPHKSCTGKFGGTLENSFAVFITPQHTEREIALALYTQAVRHDQECILFVGPSDGVKGRKAYCIPNHVMEETLQNVGRGEINPLEHDDINFIGYWHMIDIGERDNYEAFTLDNMDDKHAYVVA